MNKGYGNQASRPLGPLVGPGRDVYPDDPDYAEKVREAQHDVGLRVALQCGATNDLPTSPFARVNMAGNEVADLTNRVCAIVEKLIGSRPESDSSGSANFPCDGSIGQAMAVAESIIDNCARAHRALSDLERLL